VRRARWPEVAEEVGENVGGGIEGSEAEGLQGLVDAGAELAGGAGEVLIGQLQGEDHEAGLVVVEPPTDDAGEYFGEGALDGGGVGEAGRQVEDGRRGFAPGGARAAAGGVVEEAELLATQGGRAAGLAGGVDVMAGGCGHGELLGTSCGSRRAPRVKGARGCRTCWVNCGRPSGIRRAFAYFYLS
jgi:hypothetical protein